MGGNAWLDVTIFRCPECGWFYADSSWYVVELGADIECGKCHKTFNTKRQLADRVLLEFAVDEKGKVLEVKMAEEKQKV